LLCIEGVSNLPPYECYISDGATAITVIVTITYLPPPCFLKGSKILTNYGYLPIEQLRPGDLVKTVEHDYKPIEMIGYSQIYNPANTDRIKNRLYRCSKSQYPSLFEDLIITGCHSILVDEFNDGEREKTQEVLGKIYVTDHKYRLPACVDKRASTYETEGNFTIYHLALENDDYYMNYGVYANGLLVETCSRRYLKEISKMTLIQN
jgi:Hint domain